MKPPNSYPLTHYFAACFEIREGFGAFIRLLSIERLHLLSRMGMVQRCMCAMDDDDDDDEYEDEYEYEWEHVNHDHHEEG